MTAPCRPETTAIRPLLIDPIIRLAADDDIWRQIVAARTGHPMPGLASVPVYGPLVAEDAGDLVIGQFGQSLDGLIATPSGESKYLNGPGGLIHLHRLRALVDAVVVGVSTVIADDPLLTVRHVEGKSPARVVIDPRGRVPLDARMFTRDGARVVVVTGEASEIAPGDGVVVLRVADESGRLAPEAILAALRGVGLRQILIEGGAETVSRFLANGCLDRLHVSVAPVLVGGGRSGVTLDRVQGLADCLRPDIDVHRLGDDVLFDCRFERSRQVTTPNSP